MLINFEKKHSLYLNKQYLGNSFTLFIHLAVYFTILILFIVCQAIVDKIMSQNNSEAKAINEQIEAIEQRVKSEKAVLLEKLSELKENKYKKYNYNRK